MNATRMDAIGRPGTRKATKDKCGVCNWKNGCVDCAGVAYGKSYAGKCGTAKFSVQALSQYCQYGRVSAEVVWHTENTPQGTDATQERAKLVFQFNASKADGWAAHARVENR